MEPKEKILFTQSDEEEFKEESPLFDESPLNSPQIKSMRQSRRLS